MKSAKFWAGLTVLAVLCCASFAFGASANHSQSLSVASSSTLPATLLTFTFAPGANLQHAKPADSGWGGNGGGSGCGQGGNGGNGGNGGWGGNGGNGNGGWGGGGNGGNGGCGVPEGGNSLEYLLIGALACIGAMAYRSRRQNAMSEIQ